MATDDKAEDSVNDDALATFFLARAACIDYYARYEQVMGRFFAHLLGAPLDYAGVVFFKINNAPARLTIIDRLLKKRFGTTYNTFWDSVAGDLRRLDEKRNHIVHWIVLYEASGKYAQGETIRTLNVSLTPPNVFDRTPNTQEITITDLTEFRDKCRFFVELLSQFHAELVRHELLPDAWRDIFRQRVVYPPPDNHPLGQSWKEP